MDEKNQKKFYAFQVDKKFDLIHKLIKKARKKVELKKLKNSLEKDPFYNGVPLPMSSYMSDISPNGQLAKEIPNWQGKIFDPEIIKRQLNGLDGE